MPDVLFRRIWYTLLRQKLCRVSRGSRPGIRQRSFGSDRFRARALLPFCVEQRGTGHWNPYCQPPSRGLYQEVSHAAKHDQGKHRGESVPVCRAVSRLELPADVLRTCRPVHHGTVQWDRLHLWRLHRVSGDAHADRRHRGVLRGAHGPDRTGSRGKEGGGTGAPCRQCRFPVLHLCRFCDRPSSVIPGSHHAGALHTGRGHDGDGRLPDDLLSRDPLHHRLQRGLCHLPGPWRHEEPHEIRRGSRHPQHRPRFSPHRFFGDGRSRRRTCNRALPGSQRHPCDPRPLIHDRHRSKAE